METPSANILMGLLLYLLLFCYKALQVDCNDVYKYTLRNPEETRHNYAQAFIPSPPPTDLTCCLWVNQESDGSSALVSLALQNGSYNHMYFRTYNSDDGRNIKIVYHKYREPTALGHGIDPNTWSFLCFTAEYTNNITDQWHFQTRVMNETDYNLKRWTWTEEVSNASLPPNTVDDKEGSLVLFNDQDSYGGGLTHGVSTQGSITCFNIWRGVLSDAELVAAADCERMGDVLSLQNKPEWTLYGDMAEYWVAPEFIVNAKGPDAVYKVHSPIERANAMFRIFRDTKIKEFDLQIFTAADSLSWSDCIQRCVSHKDCYSVNYRGQDTTCKLGSLAQSVIIANIQSVSGYDHYSMVIRK